MVDLRLTPAPMTGSKLSQAGAVRAWEGVSGMMDGVSMAHRRADGALVAAVSFVILGIAPLISINVFAEKLTEVFSARPTAKSSFFLW